MEQAIKNKPKFKVGDIVYANNFYPNEKLVITTVRDLVAEGYKNLDEGEKYEYDIKRPKGKEDTFFEKWLSYRSEKMSKGNKYNITCSNCGKQLYTDDIEVNFKGNENLWLYCEQCKLSANVYIRYGKIWKVEWSRWEE